MPLATIYSRAALGIHAPLVTVEVHIACGMPMFSIVGLPEAAVRESKHRVRSTIINLGFEIPPGRVTVNLGPADLPKEGGRFDLPIALGILIASKQIDVPNVSDYEFVGELALSGELRTIKGTLPLALATRKANRMLMLPANNADEAAIVKHLTILPASDILSVCAHLSGQQLMQPYVTQTIPSTTKYNVDLAEVRGQAQARRALEIAAAGGHSLLFVGPPGTGKTMLAKRIPTILPEMEADDALEAAAIASISYRGFHYQQWKKRPFRSPHHSASSIALVGGGNPPKPGEISLAHQGVLFLDELPEFNRHVLEALREPLESGMITISRAAIQSEFPASFQLIAAMNPCPCGYLGDPEHDCRCTADQVQRYRMKISGPILDRIDMHVNVSRVPSSVLISQSACMEESSDQVRSRVTKARQRQLKRFNKINAKMHEKSIVTYCQLKKESQNLLEHAMNKLKLSARSYHRILKLALTIADLADSDVITKEHLAEALSYRQF